MEIGRPTRGSLASELTAGNSAGGADLTPDELKRLAGKDHILRPADLVAAGFSETDAQRLFDAVKVKKVGQTKTFETADLEFAPRLGRRRAPDPTHEIEFAVRNQLVNDSDSNNNACGTNSLYSVMAHHLGGTKVDFDDLDSEVRAVNSDWGASPRDLTAYARSKGLATSLHMRGDAQTLKSMIDAGLPVIVLINPKEGKGDAEGAKKGALHYVVVTGYQGQGATPDTWIIQNPWPTDDNNRNPYGDRQELTNDVFMAKWTNIRMKGMDTPIERLMITVAPKAQAGILPTNNSDWAERSALGATDAFSWVGEQLGKYF
jgi:hypothetical protein